jgi:hypothetical protein
MKTCPKCGYIVPGAWTECRRCAAPLAFSEQATTAPAPPPPFAPQPRAAAVPPPRFDDALLPAGARANGHALSVAPVSERPAGPDNWLPRVDPAVIIHAPPPAPSRLNPRTIAIGAGAVLFVVAVIFTMTRPSHHTSTAPTILAPREPYVGIPTNLADVVRIEAESTRHTALSVIISAASPNGAALTTQQLTGLQPGYQWQLANQPSTTNTQISVASAQGADVIAVSGTNKDICAFGRWSPTAGATYVTMAHLPTCAATQAPATGWSPIAGGAAQDLPNDEGN